MSEITVLHRTVRVRSLPILLMLLEAGADVEEREWDGSTTLYVTL
jgi:hypothetical protein